jgi:hypothetical protein
LSRPSLKDDRRQRLGGRPFTMRLSTLGLI